MALNKDQQRAYEAVDTFLESEEQVLSISGGAGTGKSYLIDHIERGYDNIKLCATTNEAANVIGGITIHKYLGFALGCNKVNPGRHMEHHVILVDECSMLKACILKHMLSLGNKIILVGDSNQLTVGVTINMMDYPFVELKQNMRSKSEHLTNLVKHLNDCVETQNYPDMNAHIGSHLEMITDHRDFLRLVRDEQDDYIVVAYQNAVVERYDDMGFNAMTSHKSQGKSYPVVYIDARDMISSHMKTKNQFNNPLDLNTYLRLLSVAVSRSMYKVYCFVGDKRYWND